MDLSQITLVISALITLFSKAAAETTPLNPANINDILAKNELVFVNFYADWCRFSQMLAPVFEEASNKVRKDFPDEGKIVFGKVDCDKETSIAQQYHVSKYPTLKLFRHGQLMKREYRGQRSADSLADYIKDMLKSTVNEVNDIDDLDSLDRKKRHIIGYYDKAGGPDHDAFLKIASQLRDDCVFHTAIGPISEKERIAGNKIVYKPTGDNSDMIYSGQLTDSNLLTQWAVDKCVPLVREITFENAEELTEEGLPFLILFHDPDDTETPELFKKTVARDLIAEKTSVNFLVADGLKFSHPLYHLGKTKNDLPILAIDSFRHMYLWKQNPKTDIEKGALLKAFIADLHSGKLHREFHHGPDTAEGGGTDLQVTGGSSNVVQLNVQKQVIMHGDGVRVQVVRLVQVGQPHKAVDISGQLRALAEATGQMLGVTVDQGTPDGTPDDATKDKPLSVGEKKETNNDDDDEFKRALEEMRADNEKAKLEDAKKVEPETGSEAPVGTPVETPAEAAAGQPAQKQGVPPKTQKAWNKVQEERKQQNQKVTISEDAVTKTRVMTADGKVEVEAVYDENEGKEPQPPNSIFRNLGPSRQRYTLLKDEL